MLVSKVLCARIPGDRCSVAAVYGALPRTTDAVVSNHWTNGASMNTSGCGWGRDPSGHEYHPCVALSSPALGWLQGTPDPRSFPQPQTNAMILGPAQLNAALSAEPAAPRPTARLPRRQSPQTAHPREAAR